MGIFSDEGGRIVGGHAMNSDNALKTACGLSNLWDGKPLTRVRKSEGSKIFYGRRLSMHLMIQPVVLRQLLGNEILVGQGLLSRCLLSCPAPTAGTRKYQEVDLTKESAVIDYFDLINSLLDRPYHKRESEFAAKDKSFCPGDSLEPQTIRLDELAKKRWKEFHDETDQKIILDGEFYSIKPFANKAAEQVLRVAGILSFVDGVSNPGYNLTVSLEHMERAIILIEYYLYETLRLTGSYGGDPAIALATLTLEWIKRNRPALLFPIADIYQKGPPQLREAKKAKEILDILKRHGYVCEVPDVYISGKRVKSAWLLL